jgi:hypothetical protein
LQEYQAIGEINILSESFCWGPLPSLHLLDCLVSEVSINKIVKRIAVLSGQFEWYAHHHQWPVHALPLMGENGLSLLSAKHLQCWIHLLHHPQEEH